MSASRQVKITCRSLLLAGMLVLLAACGSGSDDAGTISAPGRNSVTVDNPASAGARSAAASFFSANQTPSVASLSPSSTTAGGPAFTLTIDGIDFTRSSQVSWNGSNRVTTYVSATRLTATIGASDIALPGNAAVAVSNPNPGGGVSGTLTEALTGPTPANVAFVAPNGSDSNPGSISQPFLTMQHCASTVTRGWTCAIRAGTYRETVTPNSGITITSYDGEPVTVDGSDPVTDWTLYQGSIYQSSVTLPLGDGNQLFVGTQMMTEARWPNGDDLFHVNWATAQTGTTTTELLDSNLPDMDWSGAKIIFWSGSDPWDPLTGTVTASQTGQLTFDLDGAALPPFITPQAGGYYYLYRSLGALDAQREWFYNPSTSTLYFWAPGGVDPRALDVRAKRRLYAFDLSGASGVTVEYLNIFAATINSSSSSVSNVIDGINATYVSHYTDLPDSACPGLASFNPGCGPYSYWKDYLTTSGIVINGSGNVLRNSVISFSAGNGVSLTGSGHSVINNLIHHTGYRGNYASGINLEGTNQLVKNNTIHTEGRHGIWLNDYAIAIAPSDDEISYNNLYAAAMLSADVGEIYSNLNAEVPSLNRVTGTSIDHNWLHDTQSLVANPASFSPLPGVYIDNGSNGYQVTQNVLWNNAIANIVLHGDNLTTPNDNNVSHNSIVEIPQTGNIWLLYVPNCGSTTLVDNLTLAPIQQTSAQTRSATVPVCTAIGNGVGAAGASEMTASVQVGCNFTGCFTDGPPTIWGARVAASIAVQPYDQTVSAGQMATFSVFGAGSGPLRYQWLRNGVEIVDATNASYTTTATKASDNGAVFAVRLSNGLSTVSSDPAVLTVE
jgi:hypothetical protein